MRGILAEYFYRIVLWDITLSFFHGIYVCLFLSVDVLGYDTIDSKLWLIVSLLFVYLIYFNILPHERDIENYYSNSPMPMKKMKYFSPVDVPFSIGWRYMFRFY